MRKLEMILKKIEYLPPFSITVAKALSLLQNPQVEVDSVAEVIRYDQSVAGNLLRLCNSSYIGLRRPITNIREAVVFVGLKHLKKILLITGARPYFEARKPGYEMRIGELWRHALAVSVISEQVMGMVGEADHDSVFLASLFHDIGKLVLSEFVAREYYTVTSSLTGRNSFLEAERMILGIDHARAGARILSLWRFPEEIVTAVGKHHDPWREGDALMDSIVRISDSLALCMGYGTAVDGLAYRGCADLCRRHGISRDMLDSARANSLDDLKKIEREFGIATEGGIDVVSDVNRG